MKKRYFLVLVCFASILCVKAQEGNAFSEDDFEVVFSYVVENTNDVVLTWTISQESKEGEFPYLYLLIRNGGVIAYLYPTKRGYTTYSYTDINRNAGDYTYSLFIQFENGEMMGVENELAVQISSYAIPEWSFHIWTEASTVLLHWQLSGDGEQPEYYQIERNASIIDTVPQEQLYYEDVNLEWGSNVYRIIAYYGNGQIFKTESVDVFETDGDVEDVSYALPTNIVYVVNKNHVCLFWNTTNGGKKAEYYTLKRNGNTIATIGKDTCIYFDFNLELGNYEYRLSATYNDNFVFEVEEPVFVTVEEIEEINPYNIPFYFGYEIKNGNNVSLYWSLYEDEAKMSPQFYKIKRNDDFIAEVSKDVYTYYDEELDKDAIYVYRLISVYENENGWEWELENEITVYTYGVNALINVNGDIEVRTMVLDDGVSEQYLPLENFTCTVEDNNITISWEIPERGIQLQSYSLERNGETLIEIGGGVRSYTDMSLQDGTYSYRISGFDHNMICIFVSSTVVGTVQFCD